MPGKMYRVSQATLFADFSTMDHRTEFLAVRLTKPIRNGGYRIMTYYRVDFLATQNHLRPAKKFRTEEQAKNYARRMLGVTDHNDLTACVAIVAVRKGRVSA
jgi:hypothetical protein